jgi:uncharacterized protein YkwD
MVLECNALASHPLTVHLIAAQEQVPPDPTAPSVSPTSAPQPSVDDLEAEMLARLNAERGAAGVGPLQDQPWARSVARQHSQEMAGAGSIWHNMAGYMDQGRRVLGATHLGENVSMDRTLEANDARLFASPEHHRNIVDPQFNYVGIGIALDAKDWVYVTEDFSTLPHAVVAQAAKPALAPAPAPAVPAPSNPDPAAVPSTPARAPTPSRAALPPVPPAAAGQPAPPAAAPATSGGLTASAPDLVAATPPALALPDASRVHGLAVPAPVEAPPDQMPAAAVALAALPTAAPVGNVVPNRVMGPIPSEPVAPWMSHAPERAGRLLPAAGVALFIAALLFSRGIPGTAGPPRLGDPVVAGSGSRPLPFWGPISRPWIPELARGPPLVPGLRKCFA